MPIDFTPPNHWNFRYRLFTEESPAWYRWWGGVSTMESDILDTEHLHAYRSRVVLRQGEQRWEAWSGSSEELVEEAFADDVPHCPMLWFRAERGPIEVEVYLHINIRDYEEQKVIWQGNYMATFTVNTPEEGEHTDTVRMEVTEELIPLPITPISDPPAPYKVELPEGFSVLYPVPGFGVWAESGKYEARQVCFFPESPTSSPTSLSAFFTADQIKEMKDNASFFPSLFEQFARFQNARSHESGKFVFRTAHSSDNRTCWAILDLGLQTCVQLCYATGSGYEVPFFSPSGRQVAYLSNWSEVTVREVEAGTTIITQKVPSPKPERIELSENTLIFQEFKQIRGISLVDGSEATTWIPGVPSPFYFHAKSRLLVWFEAVGFQEDDEYGVLSWLFLDSGQYSYVTFPMIGDPEAIEIKGTEIQVDFYRYVYWVNPLTLTVSKEILKP